MATKIVTKNSSTASAVPTASDLVQGELAVNVADKRLFTEDNGGAIVELGTNPSTIDINAGSIDGTAIGASSASTGAFTTLTATGAFTSRGIDDNADATAITIDSSENVGIGISSSLEKFTVANTSSGIVGRFTNNTNQTLDLGVISGSGAAGGVYYNSANSGYHAFQVGGTERMRIDGSGNAIFTKSGGAYLQLKDASAVRGAINVTTSDGLIFTTGASFTERMRIDSSGNVGIGVANGDVTNDGNASRTYVGIIGSANRGRLNIGTTASNGADAATLAFTNGTNVLSEITVDTNSGVQNSGKMYINSTDFTSFGTAGSERMRIDSSGNVGIGRTPRVALDVAGEVAIPFDTNYGLRFYNQPQNNWSSIGNNQTNSSANLVFKDASGEAFRLDGSGNLLVGCTALPSGGAGGAGFETGQSGGRTILQLGTTVTSSEAVARFYNPNGAIGSISLSGSSTAYNTSSDQRLKENIADADDAGSKIDAIQVRQYDWKADGSHQDYGMIAQELQAVAPEAVSGDADSEDMMGVDYSKLVPMLIKEIQSLRNRVAQLEE